MLKLPAKKNLARICEVTLKNPTRQLLFLPSFLSLFLSFFLFFKMREVFAILFFLSLSLSFSSSENNDPFLLPQIITFGNVSHEEEGSARMKQDYGEQGEAFVTLPIHFCGLISGTFSGILVYDTVGTPPQAVRLVITTQCSWVLFFAADEDNQSMCE